MAPLRGDDHQHGLLGYGASGTLLTFARNRLLAHSSGVRDSFAALFAIGILVGRLLAQAVPLNLLELAWDRRQQANMLLVYLVLAVPFLFAGTAIGLALAAAGARVGRVYRSDLLGAGCGSLGVSALLLLLPVAAALEAIAGAGALRARRSAPAPGEVPGAGATCAAGAVLIPWFGRKPCSRRSRRLTRSSVWR